MTFVVKDFGNPADTSASSVQGMAYALDVALGAWFGGVLTTLIASIAAIADLVTPGAGPFELNPAATILTVVAIGVIAGGFGGLVFSMKTGFSIKCRELAVSR